MEHLLNFARRAQEETNEHVSASVLMISNSTGRNGRGALHCLVAHSAMTSYATQNPMFAARHSSLQNALLPMQDCTSLILVPSLLGAAFIWSVGADPVSAAQDLGSLRPIFRARDSTFLPLFNSTTLSWLPSTVALSTNRGGRVCHKNKLAERGLDVRASAKKRIKFSEESVAANILCR